MLKCVNSTWAVNKAMFYRQLKNVPKNQRVANITTIQLNKHSLPKQPIPALEKTAANYLRSLQPLLNEVEYKNTERVVNEFIKEGGLGRRLYTKLLERYEKTDNWMSEWWLKAAYLGYRYPVIVHSSPGTVGPSYKFSSPDDIHRYAAHLIGAVKKYDEMMKSGDIKQEMIKDIPLDMQPYAMILVLDSFNPNILQIFKLDLTNINENELIETVKDVAKRSLTPGKPVGLLTSNNRDAWAEAHSKLRKLGKNQQILTEIENALFVLCIDKQLPQELFQRKNDQSVRALQSLTGCGSSVNGANRWHDKTVQYILSYDGILMEYEHSPCEALPITVLHDHVLNHVGQKLKEPAVLAKNFPRAELLELELDNNLEQSIEEAKQNLDELCSDIDLECFTFDNFGSSAIKSRKLSPDSFIQIAMQCTFYKLHRRPPAHYESAALRRFDKARTECIRSTSNESVHFAKIMSEDRESSIKKRDAMMAAVNAHKKIATEAATGEGVDRLFFGLKMIAKEENIDLPNFFTDVGYSRSTSFTLTSSQVAYKSASFMCYGPVVPNGYGCCYNPRVNDILFACSSFNSCPETDTKNFASTLSQSLRDMMNLAEM
ncbi:hypothetical protein QAD02_017120 [Eretmocerus hayati]|uniref:Uncharacterized protein n=1 Tax=Eretmocerus hayati TaxID=131215 RepID=A0ACC2PE08_9HYME|nr:hypothetical protein QAD02_017120 [Eretmocerus hayati]